MDAMFMKLLELSRTGGDKAGLLDEELSSRLDGLCRTLSSTCNLAAASLPAQASAELLAGLQAARQIARQPPDDLPATSSSWSFTLEPTPAAGSLLTLQRTDPDPVELGLQLDRSFNLHGILSLIVGRGEDQQVLTFDLEQGKEGWTLRRWDDDRQVPFRLELPKGSDVPWSPAGMADFWSQLFPASLSTGLGTLFQPVSSPPVEPSSQAPQPAADQTMVASRPASALRPLSLVNQENGQAILLKNGLTIGRGKNNALCLEDSEVSRNHAVIEQTEAGWQIQDLNSTNGTWLNDIQVTGTEPFKEGDTLQIGKTRFHLESTT